jgi:hypothetical protein
MGLQLHVAEVRSVQAGQKAPAWTKRLLLSLKAGRRSGRGGPVSALDQRAAAELYAHAICRALGGDSHERKQLTKEVELAESCRPHREANDESEWASYVKAGGVPREVRGAFMVSESVDGSGPGQVLEEDIPKASRVLSVAEHWAALTAKGSPMLSQDEALGDLDACAGRRYDPSVIQAARLAVERGYVRP